MVVWLGGCDVWINKRRYDGGFWGGMRAPQNEKHVYGEIAPRSAPKPTIHHTTQTRTVSVFQRRTDLSSDAEASSLESRAQATSDTPCVWPASSMHTRPRFRPPPAPLLVLLLPVAVPSMS